MTVTTTQSRVSYAGDNVTLAFPIPFEFFLNTDIAAVVTANGVQTALTYGADFLLSGAGVPAGGTFNKTVPLPAGSVLNIYLNPPILQQSVYQSNAPFPAATLMLDLDRQTQISQRLQDQISRALRGPDGDASGFNALPLASVRAGAWLGFDSNGNPIVGNPAAQVAYGSTAADKFTTTAGQVAFVLSATPASVNNLLVSLDGALLVPGDDYTLSGNTLTLLAPTLAGQRLCAVYGQTVAQSVPTAGSVTDSSLAAGSGVQSAAALSVKFYGAVGNGIADDTTAIATAVATAIATGSSLFWPAGTYLTTASIANLHTVPKKGPGIIKRGANTFPVNPTWNQSNALFVATTGNDANDGLSTAQPFLTLAGAIAALNTYGPVLGGSWTINMGAGTFTMPAGATMPAGLQSLNFVQIKGVPGALPFTPTTIIDGTGAAANAFAINLNGNNTVALQDLLIRNYANGGSCYGVVGQEFSELLLTSNVQFSNVDNAVKLQQGRLYYGPAGKITGGVVGITCISGETHSIGYNASITATAGNAGQAGVGPYITGCSQAGILLQENATGHVDYTGINNSAVGIDIVCSSRANCNFSALTNNAACGLRLRDGSNWNDNGTSALSSGNGTDVLLYGGCGEFQRQGTWTIGRRQPVDATFNTQTGVLASTVVKTYANAIGAVGFNVPAKSFRVRIVGTITGATNTKNITLNLDGSAIAGFTTVAAAVGDFVMDVECYATGLNQQSYIATFIQNGQTPQVSQGSRGVTPTAGTLTINETINGAGDTISLRTVTIWNEGGY